VRTGLCLISAGYLMLGSTSPAVPTGTARPGRCV